ncbi:maestro heat-like repeat-containing protein family member 9 isoform X2 [Callorhinus ursinus]|uniref:maestro heat-like repeat-containing protein family member 9 isoform X2 n=1 Tax=Callorhinus ursinus TaxID=34884 RepID=UPI003CD02B94
MTSKIRKTSKNLRHSKDKATGLQTLQSSMKWHHMENIAACLWNAYSGVLSDQAMILAINSSFVDPLLQFETQLKIIESSFKIVFAIPTLEKVKEMGNNEDDQEDLKNLYQNILNTFEDTLLILVSKDLYKLQILKDMAVWMNEDSSYLQERIIVIISRVLSFASRKVRGYASVDAPCLGVLAAELSLLCCHNDPLITQQASSGLYHLLCIAKCQNADIEKNKSTIYDKSGNQCLLPTPSEMEFLPKVLKWDKTKITQSVGHTLLPSSLTDFVWSLLMRLSSPNYIIAFKASTMLKLTLECHAHKVTMVSKIVDAIYKKLCEDSSHVMRHAMLRVITLLTRTSPKKVIFQLMDYPVPADNTLILMWHAAGSESSVAPHVLKTILLILKGKPGEMQDSFMEKRRFSLDTTNMMPVAASQALCTLLPIGSYKKAVAQFFPQLLMALMLQLFYSSDLKLMTENRMFYARDALRVLLNCSGLQQVDIALNKKNCWNQFNQALFHHHGVYLVAKTLSEYNFPQFPETLHYLYKLSVEGPRRSEDSIITVIFLTELLNNFFKDPFPEEFLVLFRNWVNDSNPAVSKLSLQKIASMAPVINEAQNVCSLLISILDAFLSKDKTVIIRALITLRRLLVKLDKVTYSSLCTRIASSYCPLMDHRISVFYVTSDEQILSDLFLLHRHLTSHENYITDLISDALGFLRSSQVYLRRASVILIGYLAKLGGHLLLRDEIEVMLEAIDRVLRDEDPVIRKLAEITYKIFKEIAHRLTASNLKQIFRRVFNSIYTKKLKPLYNYNWPNNLAGSPMRIKETKNDKEVHTDENYEFNSVKNEMLVCGLEHISEEK